MAAEPSRDVESLLRSALRPIEPPEKLSGRVEETLSAVTEAAAEELSAWAEELSESELRSLRDPRNWVRPAAAIAAGGLAAGGLVLVEFRRRGTKRPNRLSGLADQVSDIADQVRDQVRNRLD
jgi:DNA-binding transcriptional ArsR family regulator